MGLYYTVLQLLAIPPALVASLFGTLFVSLLDVLRRRKLPQKPRVILITGATMGLGEGLALKYAGKGVTLALTGRNKALLEAVGKACEARGAVATLGNIDVTDRAGMEAFILSVDDSTPIDLVIANAGVTEETSGTTADIVAATRKLFAVNVDGVFNTILPLVPRMKARGTGQIVLMSSLAGTCGIPFMTAYCATKCAVRAYGEGLRGMLYRDGIFVNTICPGFVESPMTDASSGPMPLKWALQPAVDFMVRKLAADEPVLQFPGAFHAVLWAAGCVIPTYVKHELQRMRLPPYIAGMEYFKKRSTKKGFGAKKEGQVEAGAGKQKE